MLTRLDMTIFRSSRQEAKRPHDGAHARDATFQNSFYMVWFSCVVIWCWVENLQSHVESLIRTPAYQCWEMVAVRVADVAVALQL